MKFWAVFPLCIQIALAMSSDQAYRQHLELVKRSGLFGRRNPVGNLHGPLNRMERDTHSSSSGALNRRAARCSAKTSSSVALTSTTPVTSVAAPTTHILVQSTTPEKPHSTSKAAPPQSSPRTTSPQAPVKPQTSAASPQTTTAAGGSSGGGGGGGSTIPSDIQAYLNVHNTVRAAHGAKPLTWSDTLASAAQTWANKCVFEHSGGKLGPYGENLAAGSGDYSIAQAVQSWANEEPSYDGSNPQASHYTQMVWKASTQLGCAVASCDLSVFTPNFWPAQFYVCEYSPAGNVIGAFAQNVQ